MTPPPLPPDAVALRSVHTQSFPPLLRELGASLLVATYQAGKLVVVRADGELLNTHFRVFQRPMGLAARGERFAIGTHGAIEEYRNLPAVAAKLDPPGKHDGVFLPRRTHTTGDIDVHEMDYAADGQLWLINTRFSSLCTLDGEHSFVQRWRPHKADSGVLLDIDANETLLSGLSMPHSPRWHDSQLWLLESGRGAIGRVDLQTRRFEPIATLPGFTRGLAFAGPFAFVGVSQVRESATFSGIPLTRALSERTCGVWVVDTRNGAIVAFLRFEQAVKEILAVAVLPGLRFPDVINDDEQLMGFSFALPDAALKEVQIPVATEHAEGHQQQGIAHHQAGELEAAAALRRALALQPDYLPARFNLGVTLNDLEQFDAASAKLERVVADEAAHADAHRALGFAHSQRRDIDTAIGHLEHAVAIRPDFAEAHLSLAMLLLMQGRYHAGWDTFDWRWRAPGFTPFAPASHPRWDGAPLPDGTLLIDTEQGAGDAIQCFRFLPAVAGRCRQLLLVAPQALHPLLAGLAANLTCHTEGSFAADAFDAYLPIMSPPQVLAIHSDAAIPARVPYLQADPGRVTLPPADGRRRIGLVWAGSPTFSNDKHRSIALATLAPLLDAAGDGQ